MHRLKTFISSPLPYAIWALFVLSAIATTYFGNPYVFAFTTLILGYATIGVALVGVPAALLVKSSGWRRRTIILASIGVAGAAVISALAILRTFNWA